MLFHLHTNKGMYSIDAENPAAARAALNKKHPGLSITKVKLASGQREAAKKNKKP